MYWVLHASVVLPPGGGACRGIIVTCRFSSFSMWWWVMVYRITILFTGSLSFVSSLLSTLLSSLLSFILSFLLCWTETGKSGRLSLLSTFLRRNMTTHAPIPNTTQHNTTDTARTHTHVDAYLPATQHPGHRCCLCMCTKGRCELLPGRWWPS